MGYNLVYQPHITLEDRAVKAISGLPEGHVIEMLAKDPLLSILYLVTRIFDVEGDRDKVLESMKLFVGRCYSDDRRLCFDDEGFRFKKIGYYRLYDTSIINRARFDDEELLLLFESGEGAVGELWLPPLGLWPVVCPRVKYLLASRPTVSLEPLEF